MTDIIDPFDTTASAPAAPAGGIIDPFASAPVRTLNPVAPADEDGDFVRGFKRTLPEIKQLAGGTLAAAGDLTGLDGVRDYGLGVFQRGQQAVEALSKPTDSATDAWEKVKGGDLGAGADFLQNAAGYTAGQAAQSLAAGAAGAVLGSEVPVVGNIVGAVGGVVAKGALKKAAIEAGEKVVAKQVEKGVARAAAEKAGSAATQKIIRGAGGAALGSAAYNTTMEVGSVYPEAMKQAEEEGREMTGGEKARAVGSALAAAGIESVTDLFNLGALFRGVKDVTRDAGKQTAKQVIGAFAKRAAREAAAGAVREGSTEAVQTGLERFGARQSLNDADAWRDYIDSAAVGAVGGVLFGTAAATRPQAEQPRQRTLNPDQPPPAPDFGLDPADALRAAVLEAKTPKEFEKAHNKLVDHLAKAGRLVEGPATVVGPDGTATLPADQAPTAPAITGNAQLSYPARGLTPDVQAAQQQHPGFPQQTLPDGSPLPSPANGPLSRAVNIAQGNGALAAAAEGMALDAEAQAQVPLERDAKVKSSDADVLPPPPSNMDPETGELMPLNPEQMKAYLAEQAMRGSLPKGDAIANAFGINRRAASEMRRQVLVERRAQLEAEANDKKAKSNGASAGRTEPAGTAGIRGVDDGGRAGVAAAVQVDAAGAPDSGRPGEAAAGAASQPVAGADAGEGSLAGSLTYSEAPDLQADDITPPSGGPFTIEDAAQRVAARTEGGKVFPVDGGFVVRTPSTSRRAQIEPIAPESTTPAPVASTSPRTLDPSAPAQAEADPTAPAETALPPSSTSARQEARAPAGSSVDTGSSPSPQSTPAAAEFRTAPDGSVQKRQVDRAGRPFWIPASPAEQAQQQPRPGSRAATAQTDPAGLVITRDVDGNTVRVRQSDIDGDRTLLPMYTAEGKLKTGKNGAIHRDNLDPDGSQARALPGLPYYAHTTSKGEFPFKTEKAARAAVKRAGQPEADYEIQARGAGFVAVRKARATEQPQALEDAAHAAATSPKNDLPEPTEAQKEAGNYAKGHHRIAGLDVSIENPAGSRRRPEWPPLAHHYGYFRGTVGHDKDHVDVFLTDNAEDESRPVFVVDQNNRDGSFDEHKVILGAATEEEARKAYLDNYSKGWTGLGAITQMTQDEFRAWVKDPAKTDRPAAAPAARGAAHANATAPEHVESEPGVTVAELKEMASSWREHIDGGGDAEVTRIFDAPAKGEVVRLNNAARVYTDEHGWMTPAEAKAKIAEWKAHAKAQGRDQASALANGQKVVLSLFDLSGEWSKPWREAGYQVYQFDIQDEGTFEDENGVERKIGDINNFSVEFFNDMFGSFEGLDVHAILAACPCTDFAVSGARHFAAKDADGRTVSSVRLVQQTLAAIEYFKPSVWALENPVGRIEHLTGLPPWRLSFDPNHVGDPYTKKTLIWGRFDADLPVAPVEPTEGSKMHKLYGGKSMATKNARSVTPEGFAYSFFMANNAIDNPAVAVAGKYDRLDRDKIVAALDAGVTPAQIDQAVEEFYYQSLDDAGGNAALDYLAANGWPAAADAWAGHRFWEQFADGAQPDPEPTPGGAATDTADFMAQLPHERAEENAVMAMGEVSFTARVSPGSGRVVVARAYAPVNGEQEQFQGTGSTEDQARQDLIAQIARKMPADRRLAPAPERGQNAGSEGASTNGRDQGSDGNRAGAVRGDQRQQPAQDPDDDAAPNLGERQPSEAARAGAEGRADPDAETGVPGSARGGAGNAPAQQPSDADRVPAGRGNPPDAVVPRADFTITDELDFTGVGPVAKFNNNLAAIRLVKQLEAEGRRATADEQSVLAKYVGWGGLPQAFRHPTSGKIAKGWDKRVAELEEALTADELAGAGRSTQDAHYTAAGVVSAMWDAVRRMGFDHGRVLEPSMGTGNFFGLMPKTMRAQSALTGVELDGITGRIAKQLYQTANVQVRGFNDIKIAPGSYDLAIGNPPFGAQSIHDPQYPEESKQSIHNYFFAKSIASVRPGGVLAMVVSSSFLDANTSSTRQWIADRARFLGAIRLPQTAFEANAGTAVTTDVVFLQRLHEGEQSNPDAWVRVGSASDKGQSFALNRYFVSNPDMMLGNMVWSTHTTIGRAGAVLEAHPGADLTAQLAEAIAKLPADVYERSGKTAKKVAEEVKAADVNVGTVKVYGFFVDADGTLKQRQPDLNGEQASTPLQVKDESTDTRVRGMIRVRDAARALLKAELSDSADKDIEQRRAALNKAYDAFVKSNGMLSRDVNKRAFAEDPDAPLLLSLERDYDRGVSPTIAKKNGVQSRKESARKADIFSKRTNFPIKPVTDVTDAKSAMLASLNERGRIDFDYIKGIYKDRDEGQIVAELGDLVYRTPAGAVEPADAYLSGNVKAKLAEAKKAAESDPAMRRNVAALEAVQPADVDAADIFVQIGTPWITPADYDQFARDTFEGRVQGQYVPVLGRWTVDVGSTNVTLNNERWGTARMSAAKIVEALLTNSPVVVKDKADRDSPPVVNKTETAAAMGKASELQTAFVEWLWKDPARRERLSRYYNDTFNTDVRRKYEGSHMQFPGMQRGILTGGQLRPHQSAFAYRMVQDGTALADHVVGAGKTYASIAGVMEMRRLGLWRKPMIAVPNHLVDQWSADFLRLYPGANILAAGRKDFEKSNRRKLFGRIATGDWDAVIVAHSSFGFIPVSPEAEAATLQQEQAEIERALDAIREGAGKKDLSYKQLQKRKEALEEKLKRMRDRPRDDLLTFEEMGVDSLVLDEAHEFKNLYFVTSQRNVAGLGSPEGSKKAFDLFVKTRVLAERNDGKNLVFLTGTPVSNTLSEVFHMQRYLQLHALKDRSVNMFDSWAGVFGQVVADWEMDAAGRFKEKTRFRKFANLPELVGIWRQVTDTVTRADLQRDAEAQGQRFPLPKIKGGRRNNVVVPRSPEQAAYIGEPIPRLDAEGNQVFDNETGEPLADYAKGSIIWRMDNMPKDPTEDNHLKATGDARKAGLDFRLIDPSAPDFPQSKINTAVANTLRIWKENNHRKGTQLIFCDLSVPASARGKATESAQAKVPSWFIRRYGALQHVAGVKATLSAMPDHPFFTLKGKGEYAVHDAVSGERIAAGKLKQDAIDDANARLASDGASMREGFLSNAIPGEEIDAYIQSWQDAKDAKGEEEPEDSGPAVSMDELLADQSKFSVYDDIKAKLIAGGMPAHQVAFIHDYNTDLQKADLFSKVNRGEIRVLLGSTQKMGAGMNVQKKLVALHHMDAPWRPSDLEQREGRILRQGNEFYNEDPDGFEIELIGYATEQTYDAKQWEIIQTKAEGIETFKAGDPGVREIEDISSEAANAADMKGAASGNPLILESIKLRKEIKDLEAQERSHTRAQHTMQSMIRRVERADTYGHHNLKAAEKMAKLVDVEGPFALTIGSKSYADRKEVKIEPILAAFKRAIDGKTVVEAGGFRGAALLVDGRMPGTVTVALRAGEEGLGSTSFSAEDNVTATGFVTRLENMVSRLPHMVTDAQRQIAKTEREAEQAREELKRPFPSAAVLATKRERSAKVVAALRSGKRAVDGDPVPSELKASRIDRSLTGPLAALKAGKGNKPLPTTQARAVAAAVVAKWKGGPRVTVLDVAPEGIGADVEGWYDDRTGQVFLVAPHIKGGFDPVLKREVSATERIRMVTVHEAIGHHGIEAITGPALWAELEQTLDRMRASGKHDDLFRTIDRRYRGANRNIALREAIAVMAEKGVRNSVIDRVIAALRRFLREVAGLPMRFSEAELRQHIVAAARYVREGSRPRAAAAPAVAPGLQMSQRTGTFYSALLEAVSLGKGLPKKADAAGWRGWLDGAQRRGEFKQSERDWMGVDAWLSGQGSVSREELTEFIRASQVQVQDVMLAGDQDDTAAIAKLAAFETRMRDEYGEHWQDDMTAREAAEHDALQARRNTPAAKFGTYVLPGGENYRELLLTLPDTRESPVDGFEFENRVANSLRGKYGRLDPGDWTDEEAAAYRDEARRGDEAFERHADPIKQEGRRRTYRSGHFDQPNILAHVRFNERTDAEGNRVLFLEEVQSDWHQAGRKHGYKDGSEAENFSTFMERRGRGADMQRIWDAQNSLTGDDAELWREWRAEADRFAGGVPDAPFKRTNEWAMLAMKRMIRYAAENGFDRIAWTTGEMQAGRYDLSKQVRSIFRTRPDKDGVKLVVIKQIGESDTIEFRVTPDGTIQAIGGIHGNAYDGKRLDEVVGKEVADKILADDGWGDLPASDLKIGGDGMRAFYDKILPTEVNKFVKRFGARTAPVRLANFEADFDFIEMEDATAEELAQLEGDGLLTTVNGVDITPAMRETATQGLPLFSKADPGEVLADVEAIMAAGNDESMLARARAFVADATPKKIKDQLRGTWLGALTTRHLTELGADYFGNIKLYSEYLATMQADRNKLQTEAEGVAEGARTWASKHREEAKQLFKLMHDATIEGVDPAKDFVPLQFRYGGQLRDATPKNVKEALKALRQQMRERSGDSKVDMMAEAKAIRGMPARDKRRRNAYPGLTARWNKLSPEAKRVFVEFRDLYAKRSDQVEAGLIGRINDTDAPENHKRKMIAVIRQQFETARLQGVYFPLQRFGRFFVAAEKEGVPTFLMFERLSQLERGVKDLRDRGFTIKAQGLKQESAAKDAPSGTFVAEIIQQLKKSGVSEKTQDEIYQVYLQALPELSMRKHSIHRQSVPGFDPDAVRAFAFNMTHGAHQLARLRYAHKLEDVLTLLKTQHDNTRKEDGADTRKIAAGDAVIDELRKRHQWIMSPTDSQLTNLVSSAGFAYYLGATPAAALVNLSQTALVSFPYLASRYGTTKAMAALLKGMRDSARTLGHIQKRLTDPDELRAHQALQDMGALDKTQAHNLAGIAEGGLSGYNPKWAKAMEIIGWGFHKTEVINREATGLAAFRLARADGKSFESAVRIAADAINDTHFDYTNANRARFMQSGAAKTLLMFRQYSLNMTWHLGRMVWQATKGQDPAVRKLARRNLAGVLGMTSLFAGTLGLPLMSVTMGALNAIASSFGDDDDPWDAETEFRAFLVDMLGRPAAETLLTGPVNALTGADIHSRVSLSDLWFRDADRELDGRGAYYHLLEQAAGPMGGVLKNALVGKQLMDEGHLVRGVETTMPKSLKDMIKAARYATQGVNNLRGDPLIEDVGIRDTLLQLGGFTPAEVAGQYDENRALKNYEQFILDRRGRLMDGFAMALREGDGRDREKVLAKIRAFNKKNPELAISAKSLRASMQSRARYSVQADGGIVLNRKLAARLRERTAVAE